MNISRISIFFFFLASVYLKLPSLSKDTPPYLTCDETFFFGDVTKMLQENSYVQNEFRSGALNSLPIFLIAKALSVLSIDLSNQQILYLGRFILGTLLSSSTVFLLYYALKFIVQSRTIRVFVCGLFSLSPLILSISSIWYPDSYVFFFTTLFYAIILKTLNQPANNNVLKLGLVLGMGISIKHTFFLMLFVATWTILKSKQSKSVIRRSYFKLWIITFLIFILINYSILLQPINFLQALNGNRGIYEIDSFPRIAGIFVYIYTFLAAPLGIIAAILLIVGIAYKYLKNSQVKEKIFLQVLLLPTFMYFSLMGLSGQFLLRNLNILLPVFFMLFGISLETIINERNLNRILGVCFILMMSTMAFHNLQNWKDLSPKNGAILAEDYLKTNFNNFEIIGTNEHCQGYSPAKVAGIATVLDQDMQLELTHYLLGSYGRSPIRGFYVQENSFQLTNYRYSSAYNFNDDRIFNGWSSHDRLEDFIPDNYRILQRFVGYGEQFILIEKMTVSSPPS
jgi:hypothetical protein